MAELLKDCYNEYYFSKLEEKLREVYPEFDAIQFRECVLADNWHSLELKARMTRIAQSLHKVLPVDYVTATNILIDACEPFGGFEAMFFPEYVAIYGLHDFDQSMKALAVFTKYSSSEFAVRPFILADQQKMMKQMNNWATDSNEHLRRLASEGCRPRLPWATQLKPFIKDPQPVINILQKLKGDDVEYVRRSVANNLNDISKDHPATAKRLFRDWLQNNDDRTHRIVKHGARGLLKKGDVDVMPLFGFVPPTNLSCHHLSVSSPVKIGGVLVFSFDLKSDDKCLGLLRIEYQVDYRKHNDSLSSKVFKISESELATKQKRWTRSHKFIDLSTRKHYPGEHRLHIIVNGVCMASVSFDVE